MFSNRKIRCKGRHLNGGDDFMRELRGWRLELHNKSVRACGTDYDELNNLNGCFIITLPVVEVNLTDKALVVNTASDEQYTLPYRFMSLGSAPDLKSVLTSMGIDTDSTDVLEKCIASVPKELQPGSLWLYMGGSDLIMQSWYCSESGDKQELDISYHLGTTGVDSILVGDDEIDFRYFDHGSYIEPYVWTENIKKLTVLNQGDDFRLICKGSTLCPSGLSVEISRSVFGG